MSAFGPALFVRRLDGKVQDKAEQSAVLVLVQQASAKLGVKNDDDKPIEPRRYDYDATEAGALCVLLYSSYVYRHMPDEVREDQDAQWKDLGAQIAREVEAAAPNTYSFDSYPIED